MFAAAIHSFTATIGQAVAPGMTAIFSARVRLYSRPGNDLTDRFPLIVEALARLRPRSCIVDGEAVLRRRRRRVGALSLGNWRQHQCLV